MQNNKVQARSLVDAVSEKLEAAIINGEFQPGSKLSEQALARLLGVSRGPLREAIRRLEGRKLLQRTPNIGVRVIAFSRKDLSEILQVQEALQGLACALAAANMADSEIADLKELLEQQKPERLAKEGKRYYQESKDFDFHFRIVMGSRNERLIQMLYEDIHYLLRVYRYKFSANPEPRARALQLFQEHKEIVAAIARRDSIAAEHKMRQHIQSGAAYELRREARMAQHTPNTKSSIPRNVERAKQRARP